MSSVKKTLPAKYSKIVVGTFWFLNQLKNTNVIDETEFKELCKEYYLFDTVENQMAYYADLVENFTVHENNFKTYSKIYNIPGVGAEKKSKPEKPQENVRQDLLSEILGMN